MDSYWITGSTEQLFFPKEVKKLIVLDQYFKNSRAVLLKQEKISDTIDLETSTDAIIFKLKPSQYLARYKIIIIPTSF